MVVKTRGDITLTEGLDLVRKEQGGLDLTSASELIKR
jgi:hypothetical protein